MPALKVPTKRSRTRKTKKFGKIIDGKMIFFQSEFPRLKRRGFSIFTADHINNIKTDLDCMVMMSFLKCLAGGLRHFWSYRMGDPLAHDPKDRENREGGGIPRL